MKLGTVISGIVSSTIVVSVGIISLSVDIVVSVDIVSFSADIIVLVGTIALNVSLIVVSLFKVESEKDSFK